MLSMLCVAARCVLCPQKQHPDQFRLDYALSREQNNRKGGKMYIQDKMEEYADEIFGLLSNVSTSTISTVLVVSRA